MSVSTVIFIGPSGCGKGTQAKRLIDHWRLREPGRPVLYLETGERLRDFIQTAGETQRSAGKLMAAGARLPDFLAVWNWTNVFIQELNEEKILIIDGAPRSLLEAQTLDTALKFYQRQAVVVVFLDVSANWAAGRLRERGRSDDTAGDIARRLDWFEQSVRPAIEFYRTQPVYRLLTIDGERPVEAVTQDIVTGLWSG